MNTVHLTGRLTKDISVTTKGETVYTKYTIAVYRNKDKTEFVDCVAFGKTAEYMQRNLKKGEKILVEGSITVSEYTDKNDVYRKSTEILTSRIEKLFFEKSEKEEEAIEAEESDKYATIQ